MRALYMQLWQDLGYLARPVASATASRTSLAAESSASTGVMVAEVVRWGGAWLRGALFFQAGVKHCFRATRLRMAILPCWLRN